ncbi:MAG TPA: zinc-dependent alcohol dehydrogenase family protein [Rhodocyclaceae bacterium]|nr:zinc-dependent alcohol dehydrogenase family protein [Rhodocyclaceae bacterium]
MTMRAMVLHRPGAALQLVQLPVPTPGPGQVLVKVRACGVCRTDLHVADGELPNPHLPLIPGHEIVGDVTALGSGVADFVLGQRVGIPWLGHTCGECVYCRSGRENLCDQARFTGYTLNGGYAEYAVADHRFCFTLPPAYSDLKAAPLLCAGLIGYRALRMTGDAMRLGIYGFGAAAHLIAQVARFQDREVYAFTRPGDRMAQDFARSLGAIWAGGSDQTPPSPLDAALIFAPVGNLVPTALSHTVKGGCVVCAGIHMSDIPSFPYHLLWGERSVRSVANLTRQDGIDFLRLAAQIEIHSHTTRYPLTAANQALADLREGRLTGAAVLVP